MHGATSSCPLVAAPMYPREATQARHKLKTTTPEGFATTTSRFASQTATSRLQQSKTSLVKGHFWFPKNFANKNPLKSKKKTKRLVFFLETLKCFSQICLRPEIPRIAADKAFCWNYRKICYPAMHELLSRHA